MANNTENKKRIAKNTLLLYVRMLFLMLISLYTSRVILNALGIENFGIYNVVGGFVALFAVLSKSMSSAASRFLNFEMGKGNELKLNKVFSTIFIIHLILACVIAFLIEIIGIWYINNKMVIPVERLSAANWVFHLSVFSFCFNLITVPFNAAIIAHEKMSAFAYISILEGLGKLVISFCVMYSSIDKLVFYAVLLCLLQFLVRTIYQLYCKKHFPECQILYIFDKNLIKDISGFATWNMIGTTSSILMNQGGNLLINLFGGPVVNAARAVSNQVSHNVDGFVHNFVIALKPQITKSYARGDWNYMMTLIYQGSRLSFYMLLVLSIPIIMNTDYLLNLWLHDVPEHSVLFVQLTLILALIESLSQPLISAQLATGKIRNYQIVVGGLQMMNLPVSFLCLKMGCIPETIVVVAIGFAFLCLSARLYMLRGMIGLKARDFVNKVIVNITIVSIVAFLLSFLIKQFSITSFWSFVVNIVFCVINTLLAILFVGCSKDERIVVFKKVSKIFNKKYDRSYPFK